MADMESKPMMGRGGMRGGGGRGMPFRGGPRGGGPGGPSRGGAGGPPRGGGPGDRGGRGGNRGGPRGGGGNPNFRGMDHTTRRLQEIQGPTLELPPVDTSEKQFSGRSRLYLGNLPPNFTEEQVKDLLKPFGEMAETFLNPEKHFAFLRMDYRENAEKAKRELDGKLHNGRNLRIRFAPHQGALKVKNLGSWVSNELLHRAFSVFGDLERAIVYVDDRGRSKGEGLVEFEKKPSAMEAYKRCTEGSFFLTSSLRPVIVELFDDTDDDDGLQEKMLPKRSPEFHKEREIGPRFAEMSSFEHEYGEKWKQLYEMKKQKLEALDREMKLEEDKLIAQMEYARYEHETESLRQQLAQREQEREMTKNMWEQKEMEMTRMFDIEQQRRSEEEKVMMDRMQRQDETLKRRQEENNMFMQGGGPRDMEMGDRMRGGMGGGRGGRGGMGGPGPMGPGGFQDNRGFRGPSEENFMGGGGMGRGGMGMGRGGPGMGRGMGGDRGNMGGGRRFDDMDGGPGGKRGRRF